VRRVFVARPATLPGWPGIDEVVVDEPELAVLLADRPTGPETPPANPAPWARSSGTDKVATMALNMNIPFS